MTREQQEELIRNSPSAFAFFCLGMELYSWQIEALEALGRKKKVALMAANGSGKTACVVAVAILWFLHCFPKGRCPVVSGSWMQVEDQLFPALEVYKNHPLFSGWRWNHCKIETPEGGFCEGFSTNNELKMEGWHESEDSPVLYIVDEAKAISEPKFSGVDRCTRTFSLTTSSPGKDSGYFYDMFHSKASLYHTVRVSAFDCPHILPETIDYKKELWGEESPLYRSSVLGEFTNADGYSILPAETLTRILEAQKSQDPPVWVKRRLAAACDFAAGRDKNALALCDGVRAEVVSSWRERDTVQSSRRFARELKDWGVLPSRALGDADGLGLPMVHTIRDAGYRLQEFHGGATAENSSCYTNLISQVWIEGCRKIANGEIYLAGMTPDLYNQLTKRNLEFDARGKLRAEPKDSLKERGLHSPDDADSLLMAIWRATRPTGAFNADTVRTLTPEELGFDVF